MSETILPENAIEQAEHMRDVLATVVKSFSPNSDISLKESKTTLEAVRQRRALAKAGQTIGMPTLIPSLDYYFDGLVPGRMYGILGRPGMGKSITLAWLAWVSIKTNYKTALFSPEMNQLEHQLRVHTFASSDPIVQEACGLKTSFRNRDLMRGTGFDIKAYKRFLDYFEALPGECVLFTKKYRRNPLTAQYIASKIEDMDLHGVMVDPISKIHTGFKRNENAVWDSYDKVHAFQELIEEHDVFGVATNWSVRQQGKERSERAPDMDESFGSDALAQESDHVIGLRFDAEEKTLTMRCSKSRFGKGKFAVTIDLHPNTGFFQEVNMDSEVYTYRLSLNGSAAQNGTGDHSRVKKKKVIKAK